MKLNLKYLLIFIALIILNSCGNNATELIDAEGNSYRLKSYNGDQWMIDNLRITIDNNGDSLSYYLPNGNPEVVSQFGLLYDFESACRACPSGWNLPTNKEWERLLNIDKKNNASDFMDPKFWRGIEEGNSTGFTVLPAGYGNNGIFDNHFMSRAIFTSKTEYNEESITTYVFEIGKSEIRKVPQQAVYGFSVRCVRD